MPVLGDSRGVPNGTTADFVLGPITPGTYVFFLHVWCSGLGATPLTIETFTINAGAVPRRNSTVEDVTTPLFATPMILRLLDGPLEARLPFYFRVTAARPYVAVRIVNNGTAVETPFFSVAVDACPPRPSS